MIKVDISNVWGQIALPDLLAMEKEVAQAHATLVDGTGAGNDFLGWQNLPTREPTEEILRIQSAARKIRNDSDVFVVIGIGGSYLGPRAAIELLQGPNHNMGKGKGDPQIYFAGNGLSTRHWNELSRLLEGKDFSIAIISKSGTTTEPAIATRALRAKLEEKYGVEGAKSRIYAITDPCKGALRQMANEEGWETFVIPANVGGRFSVLTPVGLLPLAVAGVDIMELTAHGGARTGDGGQDFTNHSWWQGKLVSLSGQPGYLSLQDIGYGDVRGFAGANCRHNWHPFWPGISKPAYTQEMLDEYNAPKFPYNGKLLTEEEADRRQRALERQIRRWKREYALAKETDQPDLQRRAATRLAASRGRLEDFLQQTGRHKQQLRETVPGFGRSEASSAAWAARQ